jgi:hypothetical protein
MRDHRLLIVGTSILAAFDQANFEWPALLRKLDRIDPSYKQ